MVSVVAEDADRRDRSAKEVERADPTGVSVQCPGLPQTSLADAYSPC